ncbi:DVU_1555 family C-GCAxxG-C-C protein [Azospirillum sp. ST 5-10]|uniref:DVU_1555 family C-GCAxxG-C-C protein n=1 Tax=unclassified Azospirillum TaxID=2630922 RepID=UPI003F4A7741
MNEDTFRIAELLLQGYKCSHILVKLALEAQGRDAPDVVRAMSGLALGMGRGFNCGALSGGCCVLGLCAGRGADDETEDPRFKVMLDEFAEWFETMATETYGGIDCADIMAFDQRLKQERCPALIAEVWRQVQETMADHGAAVAAPPRGPAAAGGGAGAGAEAV